MSLNERVGVVRAWIKLKRFVQAEEKLQLWAFQLYCSNLKAIIFLNIITKVHSNFGTLDLLGLGEKLQ